MNTGKRKDVMIFYEEDSKIYDEDRFESLQGRYIDWSQKDVLLKMNSDWKNKKILDIATGTGRFATIMAKCGADVFALDSSLSMLKKTKEKNNKMEQNKIVLVNGDACNIPFDDNSFDGCTCINALNHIPNYKAVLGEVSRVLKPNGLFIATFPNMFSLFLPVALWVNFRRTSVLNNVYTKWFTLFEVKKALSNAGLKIQEIEGDYMFPPLSEKSLFLMRILDDCSRSSALKYFSGSPFIKSIKRGDK
jgi:ubiquinone/menaquinone biosynthesis C-methylase UbiE